MVVVEVTLVSKKQLPKLGAFKNGQKRHWRYEKVCDLTQEYTWYFFRSVEKLPHEQSSSKTSHSETLRRVVLVANIISDYWKAYNCLDKVEYQFHFVNQELDTRELQSWSGGSF